ncbi:Zn(2)-C6 fungal-type domain-containing protein [Mycena sanguinolenta]|uniref:Zn(2)-C6 fungal-type domain-containing protein n=1 Tax=Mycena sanguinolenta TaxID=230812 RepID=A0A8H6XTN1_9AGAR|nr:Zn(2)-C6 fungal-type domain-containing protein [Mycena sanguinolenta]
MNCLRLLPLPRRLSRLRPHPVVTSRSTGPSLLARASSSQIRQTSLPSSSSTSSTACTTSPESRHPLFHPSAIRTTLLSTSYNLHLLPPPARVLATCACGLAASISFHPAIIGPSNIASFTDPTVFCAGADLREYGVRRASMCRALCARAVALACEERVHLNVCEENAVACFLLDVLERRMPAVGLSAAVPTRPWAVSYVSHARILAGHSESKPHPGFWNGFLMAEALAAMARRTPVLFTYNDHLLLSGSEPPSLEQLLQSLQAMAQASKRVTHLLFPALWPFMFHVIRLARDLYDKISGDYARRHPLSEPALVSLLSSLSLLQSILALILTHPRPRLILRRW